MNRRQQLALAGSGVLAAAAGMTWALLRHPDGDRIETALLNLRFDRPEGGELSLSSWSGRVLVLNFWATWCPPCIKELPEFDRLHRSQQQRGVMVVGLAVDGPTPVRQFLARQPVSFPIGLAGFEGTDLSRKLGNTSGALPFTVIIDRVGKIRHRKLGQTEFDELTGWVRQL
jgi:thiol-disulfide isomerase/thioredoxin